MMTGAQAPHNLTPPTMNVFTLASGRRIEKDATHCVAVKCNGRWSHRWFKSHRGAQNEFRSVRAMSESTRAYYGLESYRMILPDPT
jgi:hypothetical protein